MIKTIFIASSSYSGSTMLDLMLGNNPDALSLGELSAFRNLYNTVTCSCGQHDDCEVWSKIQHKNRHNYYKDLSKLTGKETFIDSSKNTFWIREQRMTQPYTPLVLIYKHPKNYAYSCMKRGNDDPRHMVTWIEYNSAILRLKPQAIVSYYDLVHEPKVTLEILCNILELPYRKRQEIYWDRHAPHHLLYGSGSAKLHLWEKGTPEYDSRARTRQGIKPDAAFVDEISYHRKFYYSKAWKSAELDEEGREILDVAIPLYDRLEELKI